MTIKEYLEENESIFNNGLPIKLMDILTNRMIVYCGGGYKQLFSESSLQDKINNSRFAYEDFKSEEECIVLYCLKEIDEYSQADLCRLKKSDTRSVELTVDEIDCFNAYIEDAKMDIEFGNSDWCDIYHKIVGDRVSEYAKEKMDRYF